MFPAYLIEGLLGIAALCWVLYQANLRHRRLQAELLRLDRLAAEVTLHAEAVLDQVDERTAQLQKLLDAATAQVAAATGVASAPAPTPTPVPAPAPGYAPAPALARAMAPAPSPEPPPAQAVQPADENDSLRYSELRTKVAALAEGGIPVAQIAQMLGVPRGEVSLILNLQKKKSLGLGRGP
ncbi:MAG TPA: hypothetical protein VD973_03945 [Symbiobacteriaceae bacterium]|nr:hypothetical protein [Symbiobacteriaceae bacterium]